jgi:hypothetical protein
MPRYFGPSKIILSQQYGSMGASVTLSHHNQTGFSAANEVYQNAAAAALNEIWAVHVAI